MPNLGTVTGSGAQGAGRWANPPEDRPDLELASAARVVGTAQGSALDVRDARTLVARLNITTHNGGTVTASLEGSSDGTNWNTIGSWPAKSGSNQTHKRTFEVTGYSQVRWAWVVATATVTFQVDQVQAYQGR